MFSSVNSSPTAPWKGKLSLTANGLNFSTTAHRMSTSTDGRFWTVWAMSPTSTPEVSCSTKPKGPPRSRQENVVWFSSRATRNYGTITTISSCERPLKRWLTRRPMSPIMVRIGPCCEAPTQPTPGHRPHGTLPASPNQERSPPLEPCAFLNSCLTGLERTTKHGRLVNGSNSKTMATQRWT